MLSQCHFSFKDRKEVQCSPLCITLTELPIAICRSSWFAIMTKYNHALLRSNGSFVSQITSLIFGVISPNLESACSLPFQQFQNLKPCLSLIAKLELYSVPILDGFQAFIQASSFCCFWVFLLFNRMTILHNPFVFL